MLQAARLPLGETSHDDGFEEFYRRVKPRPIFLILGVQGSGTRFLCDVLTRVCRVSVLRDHALVVRAARRLGSHPSPAAVERQFRFVHRRMFPTRTREWFDGRLIRDSGPFRGIERTFRSVGVTDAEEFVRVIHAYRAFTTGSLEMAVKSDDLWAHMGALDEVMPNRRVILLVRDFRDTAASVCRKNFGPVEPLLAADYVRKRFIRYEREYRRSNGYLVRYEDLVQTPVTTLKSLCDHFAMQVTVAMPDVARQMFINAGTVKAGRGLSDRDRRWCGWVLRDELVRYGYELSPSDPLQPGSADYLLATMRDVMRRVPQKLRHITRRVKTL